jgi:hypothetical protein
LVFWWKEFTSADKVFVPIFNLSDFYLLEYAKRLINNNNSQIIILDVAGQIRNNIEVKELIRSNEQVAQSHHFITYEKKIEKEFLNSHAFNAHQQQKLEKPHRYEKYMVIGYSFNIDYQQSLII